MQRIVKTVTVERGKLYTTGGEMSTALTTFDHDAKTGPDRQGIESV